MQQYLKRFRASVGILAEVSRQGLALTANGVVGAAQGKTLAAGDEQDLRRRLHP